ncbi:TonB-dependent receptor domain-containing protein [Steroidobacter cummioxidans]|uniref:TonB-dependent receptor domain-containing protein n=1 Tax=Steroidobacter cummioxidans TaxID=1803913 RepID=UPI000E30C7EE|nr:TonB-dependent receptor [Steroidobacter cummioxidans]
MSWKSTSCSLLLAASLTACGCIGLAASPGDRPANANEHEERYTLQAGVNSARAQANALRILTGYEADPGECGDVMLGPLPPGEYTGKEAWLKLVETACHLLKRPDGVSGRTEVFADVSDCQCSFGLQRFAHLQQNKMLVTSSSLPELAKYIPAAVLEINRKRIHDTGAASIPDLLRYISQTAFHRSQGYRASGAQYAELRGLGASYTLVLLNGRRTFGTAADLANNAFDLSTIPISAVERVEISMDANSLVHGMDAVGGTVNIVLRDSVDPVLYIRHGSAQGGASQNVASISGGMSSDRGRVAVFLDVQRWGELLGSERERWNDQDFRRYGALDYRSPLSSPLNVRSSDGQNLPGLDAPFAAARVNPDTGMFDFIAGQHNLSSWRAYQAIVPASSRVSMLATGSVQFGASTVSMELLGFKRATDFQLRPVVLAGETLAANHPENPFGVPVIVDAVLAGVPAQGFRYETNSTRAVAAAEGPIGPWKYSAFVVRSDEKVDVNLPSEVNASAIERGLQGDDPSRTLSIYSTVRRTAVPADLLIDTPANRYHAGATQVHASAQGALARLPAGQLMANLGIEGRRESMDFDPRIDSAHRNITSRFAHLRVPVLGPGMNIPAVRDMALILGMRTDDYADIRSISRRQLGMVWNVSDSLRFHAATSESFRPPSLVDMNQPRVELLTQIYDPKLEQVTPVQVIMGGNPQLQPSTGLSTSIGVLYQAEAGLRLSAEFWRVKVRDHISTVTASSLLSQQDSTASGRIVRDSQGRLVSLDLTRANAGAAATEGVDLEAQTQIETRLGLFMPRLLVTLTDEFQYSDQPSERIQMESRLGVASQLGTIPRRRAVASLTYENDYWRASVHAHLISSYRDRSDITGQRLPDKVPGGEVWDFSVSRNIAGNLRLTLGAVNVLDREPPFARVGGSLGFDPSQAQLEGRQIYGTIAGTF